MWITYIRDVVSPAQAVGKAGDVLDKDARVARTLILEGYAVTAEQPEPTIPAALEPEPENIIIEPVKKKGRKNANKKSDI